MEFGAGLRGRRRRFGFPGPGSGSPHDASLCAPESVAILRLACGQGPGWQGLYLKCLPGGPGPIQWPVTPWAGPASPMRLMPRPFPPQSPNPFCCRVSFCPLGNHTWCAASSSHASGAAGKHWSRDYSIDYLAMPTLPAANLPYKEALGWRKWAKVRCSFLLLSARF